MDRNEKNLELAVQYYFKHNIQLKESGVSYSSVAKKFGVLRCELVEEVENKQEEDLFDLESEDEMGNPDWEWLGGTWEN